MATSSEPTEPDIPPSVEQIWKAIDEDRITTDIAEAIYRRLAGDDADTSSDGDEEFWLWVARYEQEGAFIKAVMDIAERKVPEEKVALALLLEEGGIDKAALRYEKFAYADREAWADRFRTMAGLFAVAEPSSAILAYARVVALEPDNEKALFALARLMHRTEDPRAEGWYQRIIDHPTMEPSSRANAMREVAAFVARDGRLDVAYDWHEKAYHLYTELGEKHSALGAIFQLTVNAGAQGHTALEEQWGEAYVQGRTDLDMVKPAADMLSHLADLALDRDDQELAEARTQQALSLYKKVGNRKGIAWELRTLSVYEAKRGDNRATEKLLKEALAHFKELDDRENIIEVLGRLGSVAEHQERFRRAKAYLQEALDLSKQWGEEETAGDLHRDFVRFADRRDEGKEAAHHEKQAIEHYERAGAEEKAAYVSVALGDRLFKAGDLEGAKSRYERSCVLYERIGERIGVAAATQQLGFIYERQEDWGLAERWFEHALTIFTELDKQECVADTSLELGRLAVRRGDIEGARDHWGRALTRYTNVGKRYSPEGKRVMELLRMTMSK